MQSYTRSYTPSDATFSAVIPVPSVPGVLSLMRSSSLPISSRDIGKLSSSILLRLQLLFSFWSVRLLLLIHPVVVQIDNYKIFCRLLFRNNEILSKFL